MRSPDLPDSCVDGARALGSTEIEALKHCLDVSWEVTGTERIERRLEVQDFQAALDLVQAIGAVAEEQNHHPDLAITAYRRVTVSLSTHDAGGLTENDFVLARRIDALAG